MSDKHLSIITAVDPNRSGYLAETEESVRSQVIPYGWTMDWHIHIDGPGDLESTPVGQDVHLHRSDSPVGVAAGRNLAAAYARGSVLRFLDADDVLTPGSLARTIEVMSSRSQVGWVCAKALDLNSDGTTSDPPLAPRAGSVDGSEIVDAWRAHKSLLVHPATLAVRSKVFFSLGGYPALERSEDIAMIMMLCHAAPGYFDPTVSMLYRKWSSQMTAHAPALTGEDNPRFAMIDKMIDSWRAP